MKKIISKFRNKRLKGNISLLVILILLASSVISLLSINQIQRLLTYGNMTFNYFRSFYIAKAWTELWLVEVYNSKDWFNSHVETWDNVVVWNLLPEYSGFNPYFDVTITWRFEALTNDIRNTVCEDEENYIRLSSWAWIMLSLSYDNTNELSKILSDKEDSKDIQTMDLNTITALDFSNTNNTELTFSIFVYGQECEDGECFEVMKDIIVHTWTDLGEFLKRDDVNNLLSSSSDNKKYLTIKNSSSNEAEFCIKWSSDIPYSNSIITVQSNFWDMEVWIQSVVKKWVPDWSLNVIY